MRPLWIEVEGLASYRERVRVDFYESNLWAIVGRNGEGKSALLDVIPFVLFGYSRSRRRGYEWVINDECDKGMGRCAFRLNGQTYRATRIVQRKRGKIYSEGLIERFDGQDWVPVPNTRRIRDMEEWIRRHLRLRLESFTSSAMLLQGKATAFFDADPAEQLKMLIEITGLDFYRELGEEVAREAKRSSEQVKHLVAQLEQFPEVSEDDLLRAREAVSAAEVRYERAEQARSAAVEELGKAKEYARLTKEQSELQIEVAESERLAAHIEEVRRTLNEAEIADRQRLTVGAYYRTKNAYEQTARELEGARQELEKLRSQYEEVNDRRKNARDELDAAQQALAAREQALEEARARVVDIQGELTRAEEYERVREDVAHLEKEIAAGVEALKDWDRLGAIVAQRDIVVELRRSLDALGSALDERNNVRIEIGRAEGRLAVATARAEEAKLAFEGADQALRSVLEQEAKAQAALEEAQLEAQRIAALADARSKAVGADACPTCGRKVDAHAAMELEQELATLQAQNAAARQRLEEAKAALASAREARTARENELRAALAQKERSSQVLASCADALADLKQKHDERQRAAAKAWRVALQHAAALSIVVPDPKKPEAREVLLREVGVRERAIQEIAPRFQELSDRRAVQQRLEVELERGRVRLSTLEAPKRPLCEIRSAFEAAQGTLKACEQAVVEVRGKVERQRAVLEDIERIRQEVYSEGKACSGRVEALTAEKDRKEEMARSLWEDAVASGWDERVQPTQEDVDRLVELARPLAQLRREFEKADAAQRKLDNLRLRLRYIAQDMERLAGAKSLDEAQAEHERSQNELKDAQNAVREATARLEALEAQAKMRAELVKQRDALDADAARLARLVEPLGKKGIQARLLHQALADIILYANDVLGRISDDVLQLELNVGENDDEFSIMVRKATLPKRARDFSELSGGEKFRVAIAMALGIGQYLADRSGGNRVEFLVIDEGFAELDAHAANSVIEELERIAVDVGTVIVVSHDWKVLVAFKDRYLVELTERHGSQVRRIYDEEARQLFNMHQEAVAA